MNPIRIFPSLISADILNLSTTITTLDPYCAGFHIDIMDNHFVPNLTWGPCFANAIDAASVHPSWIHLMVDKPETIIDRLTLKKNSIVSFHVEATKDIERLITIIQQKNWVPSLAIKPTTQLEKLYPYLPHIQHVLVMSVEPGFSGQPFLANTLERLAMLSAYITHNRFPCTIALDGGINKTTLHESVEYRATDFAIASALFNQRNILEALSDLYQIVKR